MKFPTLSKKTILILTPLVVVLVFVASIAMLQVQSTKQTTAKTPSAQEYQQELQSQVDTETGAPRSGRDPAAQGQATLASAANTPSGVGHRTDTPAANVDTSSSASAHGHHATSADVYGTPGKDGVNSAGCYVDYGIQGQQCLPRHASGTDGQLTCAEVRVHFAKGIKVTGTDRFNLDANGDKTACGLGE